MYCHPIGRMKLVTSWKQAHLLWKRKHCSTGIYNITKEQNSRIWGVKWASNYEIGFLCIRHNCLFPFFFWNVGWKVWVESSVDFLDGTWPLINKTMFFMFCQKKKSLIEEWSSDNTPFMLIETCTISLMKRPNLFIYNLFFQTMNDLKKWQVELDSHLHWINPNLTLPLFYLRSFNEQLRPSHWCSAPAESSGHWLWMYVWWK